MLLKRTTKDNTKAKPVTNVEKGMSKNNVVFALIIAAAVLILINAWTVATGGNPKFQFDLLGTTFKMNLFSKELLPIVSSVGYGWLLLGIGVLIFGILLRLRPKDRGVWSIIIFVLSCTSVIIGGGYIVGLFLGVLGSILEDLTKRLSLSKPTFFGDVLLFFTLAYIGNEADNALGNFIFGLPPVYEGLFLMSLETLRLSFIVAPFFYFAIRLVQAMITTLIATPLLRNLKYAGFSIK